MKDMVNYTIILKPVVEATCKNLETGETYTNENELDLKVDYFNFFKILPLF